jgi:hypothetical protein
MVFPGISPPLLRTCLALRKADQERSLRGTSVEYEFVRLRAGEEAVEVPIHCQRQYTITYK